jgi:hypothetical protein
MGTYFVEKIHNIHTNLENMGHDQPEFEVYNTSETAEDTFYHSPKKMF